MKTVTKIEPVKPVAPELKKVAAYARVSMESERLQHSLAAQVSYYSDLIQKHPGWQYAGVYADDGITGTKMSKRDEFNRMLQDCEDGKIDIILTKSISRFARNTVDLLTTVRHLKELGISVRFEKEKIDSLSEDGELMLTLLASFAQEEVRSLSENVKWGARKRMEQGIPNGHFNILGYEWEDDHLVIVPEEAAIVRRIFQNFLDGKSRLETEREFAAEGITTKRGYRFVDSNIKVILTNITYTGNLLLQKEFISDPINKKRRKNHGELPQYYVENTHEPIIDMETFQFVQAEIARRKELGALANKSLNTCCFTGKIKCGVCGCSFMHNVRKNRAKSVSLYGEQYATWGCGTKKKKGSTCRMKEIPEVILKQVCADILGLDEFDEAVFTERVDWIAVPEDYTLVFHFKDGTEQSTTWKSTAKSDVWDDAYKDRQREWVKNHMANSDSFSEFTTRFKCGVCGSSMRRSSQPSKTAEGGKQGYWRCSCTDCSNRKGYREDFLIAYTNEVLGLDERDPDAFRDQIDFLEAVSPLELVYHFKDGREIRHDWPKSYPRPKWSEAQRAKFKESAKTAFPPERRQAMSEKMKQIRSERKWPSKKEK